MSDGNEVERLRLQIADLERRLAQAERAAEPPTSSRAPATPHQERRGELVLGANIVEREALLAKAESTAQMGTWVWDLASNQVSWSDELFHILGYDLHGDAPSVDRFFQRVHPDDRDRVRGASSRGASTGETGLTTYRLLLPGGVLREVAMDGVAILGETGKPVRMVGTVLDVTQRRAAERELRRSEALLNEAQRIAKVGSFTWDLATNAIEWSDELYRLAGIDRGTPLDAVALADLIHKDDRRRALARADDAVLLGEAIPDDIRIIRRGDRSIRNVHVVARPIRGGGGELQGFVGTVLDITERKQLEEQLRQSQKMEALGRLAGGVAHDFNNLLTVIEGYTQLLRREWPREELDQIAAASAAAADLTRRLLAFSRHSVIEPVALDLNAAVEGAVKLISRVIGEDIKVTLELAPSPWKIRADPSQVHQVLLNLTLNARDAMPNGGRLVIRTSNVILDAPPPGSSSADHVLLEVSDTGVGMDEETKARVFEPFFTTKELGKGTGLGLATVFAIVRRSLGLIDLSSSQGHGTTFKLHFPRTQEQPPESIRKNGPQPSTRGSEVILVVEDDPAVRRLLTRVLEGAGYRVYAARLPSEARSLWSAEHSRISLLITDVVMPEQSGRDLARELRAMKVRERAGSLRVLYITGYAPRATMSDDTPLDAPYLPKPFTPDDLLTKVRTALFSALSGPIQSRGLSLGE